MKRLLSGIRPDGPLHLGHYLGVVRQWLTYQGDYECFLLIADVQALTTHQEQPEVIATSVREVALDWLAAGLDPRRSHFLVQSQIPELAELTVYLQMLVRTGELRDNPTMREEARAVGQRDLYETVNDVDFGLLGYPVAQVADILLFTTTPPREGDSLIVPVGEDQLPHVELACKLARRFNRVYGRVFLEPEARTAPVAQLPGTDGGYKMGKIRRNTILLKEAEEKYAPKIRGMFTDPLRLTRTDPGHPDACPCFAFLAALRGNAKGLEQRRASCMAAGIDCEECKEDLVGAVRDLLGPLQERRAAYAGQPALLEEILTDGIRRAREVAGATMERVRDAMRLTYPGLIRKA
ncbi:MAG: tryptophan--tRNA ligase [Planctomycetota bacterium]